MSYTKPTDRQVANANRGRKGPALASRLVESLRLRMEAGEAPEAVLRSFGVTGAVSVAAYVEAARAGTDA